MNMQFLFMDIIMVDYLLLKRFADHETASFMTRSVTFIDNNRF